MEKVLQDHFKDATDLLLIMDHDSGFVEMVENASCSVKTQHEPENFLLSEDALQEKPEINFNFNSNFQYDINPQEYEESRKLFFSPEYHNEFGFADKETKSDGSSEISLQPPIEIANSDIPSDVISDSDVSTESSNSHYSNCPPSQNSKKLTLVFFKQPSETYSVKRKYPSLTPEKKTSPKPDISPDIFDDTEMLPEPEVQPEIPDTKLVEELDQKLLKRVQKSMSGVLPPPSVTVVHFSLEEMMERLRENEECAFWRNGEAVVGEKKSLLLNTTVERARTSDWPETYRMRCHGICYNSGKISEEIVDLCDKYQKRHVGAETQSSCTAFDIQHSSPSKRKAIKPKWCANKSPGRRLSHLARRRITFSSNNLNTSSCLAGSRARQILVDAKKIDLSRRKSPRKTPKKTPRKSPKKTRTPSSSAKKKLALRFRKLTGEIEQTSGSSEKRILFKSPAMSERKGASRNLFSSPLKEVNNENSCSTDKNNPRRALFQSFRHSPSKHRKSPFKFGEFDKKRKRSESDFPPSKFPRSISMDVKMGESGSAKIMSRTQSEMNMAAYRRQSQGELSELHKKKLLWAVSTALQTQNVTSSHPQWKTFASILARVTRIIFMHQTTIIAGKSEGGTSEKMQRIARSHALSVIKGKSADEVVQDYFSTKSRVQKPQGYVAPTDRLKMSSGIKENVFQDRSNTIESWEKKKLEQLSKPSTIINKIERIKKVINFGDDS